NTLPPTTSIVDRLEKKGLVVRTKDPDDRRVVICELTEEGQKATERFWRVAREAALRVAGKWDQEQLESVVKALELILRTHKEIVQSGVSSRANE
ncbi:MAG: MarR family transcriptional regulator, partial [Gemmatimonadetes bacterium]|nr:MarR family transcriptional regulator [Gemmatimonadota bacterium]